MKLPRGTLEKSRVVPSPGATFETALERELTGYAVLVPQDSLLLDEDGRGVVTFEAGIPLLAYHTGTNRGGPAALADLAVPGPYSVSLFSLSADVLAAVHENDDLAVPPGMPAERVAGDAALAARTRAAAPTARLTASSPDAADEPGAVEAFLADEEKIAAIQQQARAEAAARAEEWGFSDHTE
ncbi:hypothetical protein [Haladaptatus sp. DJG-WS-42]|uniref:hypothetical protein n=1 Tax=Haladaptatus sp. DJG-WS-42 TaxID=3120516 RepID=UPI0030CDB816